MKKFIHKITSDEFMLETLATLYGMFIIVAVVGAIIFGIMYLGSILL